MLKVILQEVCSITGESELAIKSKNRKWPLMYARYLFFDVAVRLGVKHKEAAEHIGRNRTMIYPYVKAINDLIDVNSQFRNDREALFNILNNRMKDDTA